MLCTVLVAGVAHARLFSAPAPNFASPPTVLAVNNAASPLVQPQVMVEMPVPQRATSGFSPMSALGVALFAAGVGTVAGRQAMIFFSGNRKRAEPKDDYRGRNRDGKTGTIAANQGFSAGQSAKSLFKSNAGNQMKQKNGFGTFVQKFQTAKGKSKYGVPIFLANGNVNPAYLAAERKDMQKNARNNTVALEKKRKDLIANSKYRLADFIRKAVGPVGSGKEYYQSGQ